MRIEDVPTPCVDEANQIVEGHDVASEADAGFDGGEFSGPAHHEMMLRELGELAKRYGLDCDGEDLLCLISNAQREEFGDEEFDVLSDAEERAHERKQMGITS